MPRLKILFLFNFPPPPQLTHFYMNHSEQKSRLLFPKLGLVYDTASPYTWLLLRLTIGLLLIPHGFPKIFGDDAAPTSRNFVRFGWDNPLEWAYFIGYVEFLGGLFLATGFLTRFAALVISIEMFVISFAILYPNWGWSKRGMEYALFLAIVSLIFVFKGGGKYSIDRLLPKEI